MTSWQIALLVLALVMAAAALILAARARAQHVRAATNVSVRPIVTAEVPGGQLVAFVANPTKPEVAELRSAVKRACSSLDLPTPLWFETTAEDPGIGQTRRALKEGADVVVTLGGDGTVRAVARALAGTGTPMGILPLGTGNLLARNLDIPIGDLEEALLIALEGRDRAIDVGWLKVLDPAEHDAPGADEPPSQENLDRTDTNRTDGADPDRPDQGDASALVGSKHLFLVIAGLGFDAAMVADANSRLKARVGWVAYFLSGIRHLHGRRLDMQVTVDDHPTLRVKVRTILMGNCGRLPGGLTLMPDAVPDDGILDVAAIDTRGGIAGWAQLFGEVVMQGFGVSNDLPNKIGRIDHTQCEHITVRVKGGAQAQVDGDIIGRATAVESWVDHEALVVRVPRRIRLSRTRAIFA